MTNPSLLLALDTGSPVVSVALGSGGRLIARREMTLERSSRQILRLIEEVLAEGGVRPRDLGGIAALRGPGSFTGLRIGLSTALGLHQALGIPATALSTLRVLALAAILGDEPPQIGASHGAVVTAVDALRGEWMGQAFTASPFPHALGEPALTAAADLPALAPKSALRVVGFGVAQLAEAAGWTVPATEPGALAPVALRLAAMIPAGVWDPASLTEPLYARPPAVTPPKPRGGSSPPVPAA
jgi:tRNA threonylcarbamoyladenosine biosynthesis protein TsaB